jgi:hypothetical protein
MYRISFEKLLRDEGKWAEIRSRWPKRT